MSCRDPIDTHCEARFDSERLAFERDRYITSTQLSNRIKLQLSTLLFSKTLVKKDLAATNKGSSKAEAKENRLAETGDDQAGESKDGPLDVGGPDEEDEEDVSSKAQIMVSADRRTRASVCHRLKSCICIDAIHCGRGSSRR